MDRKSFLNTALAFGTGTLAGFSRPNAFSFLPDAPSFTLNYAPHFGMFEALGGAGLTDQLRFMAEMGFRALEDNEMRNRPLDEQETIAREMEHLGMRMGVFVAHTIGWREPNLTSGDKRPQKQFLEEIRASVEVAKRVNARWMTVVPGREHPRLEKAYQTANLVETLRKAADILEPHNMVMVLEPLNTLRDHPGQFLTKTSQAYEICRAVDSPSCKILYDVYHQQITEGNLIPNIDYAWEEIAYIQVGDHPGRHEPTTGEINYLKLFAHLHRKGYKGIIGMEHGNSRSGPEGEEAVIEAYKQCDPD